MVPIEKLNASVDLSGSGTGILFTLRYLCEPKNKHSTSQAIWEDIFKEDAKHSDVSVSFPA